MRRQPLYESVPNFSEGTRTDVIAELAGAAAKARVLDVDADPDHNRVVISLAGDGADVVDALFASVQVAMEHVDLREHRGVHPRVGAADVLPIVPLGGSSLASAHELARELGERIWAELHVPVYFYGHGEAHTLADVRAGRAHPDLGGPDLARSVRESAGGLRGVQALAFPLPGDRAQLSMNLFRLDETPPSAVIEELERRGVAIGSQHVIGLCPAAVANPAAHGRLLEARLAAAAARHGAELCAAQGDDEHTRLAGRLEREAGEIARMGVDQGELLAGAERAAALVQVLRAAGVLGHELETMLDVAARGLRSALAAETSSRHSARVDALDRRLGSASGNP